MALFKCPECATLSHSDRKATYFWCACGRPLTAADAVPGLPHEVNDSTPPPPPPPKPEEPAQEELWISPAVKAKSRRRFFARS